MFVVAIQSCFLRAVELFSQSGRRSNFQEYQPRLMGETHTYQAFFITITCVGSYAETKLTYKGD
jgi:hypothetical protein